MCKNSSTFIKVRFCIIDGLSIMSIGNIAKVLGWCDNEYGYSKLLVNLIKYIFTSRFRNESERVFNFG
jgi:glyceraldehyde-3-phosphate dehydrogenase/erythrose-4-phosphate dehydrogenase